MSENSHVTRREFIQKSATTAAAVGAVGAIAAPASAQVVGANERLRIGFIGPGGRGLSGHVGPLCQLRKDGVPIELVAVNDVYINNADKAFNMIKRANRQGTQALRRLSRYAGRQRYRRRLHRHA